AGVAPQLRRAWRVGRGLAFAARAYLVFPPLMLIVFLAAACCSVRVAWNAGRAAARAFLRFSAISSVPRGLERLPGGAAVIAANHASYADGLVLMAMLKYRGYAFVAKREFLGNFFMRIFLGGLGSVFVERFDVQKSAEQVDELVAAARHGASLIVF